MERVYHADYDTDANLDSPAFALPDFELESIGLDHEKRLQMFERHAFSSPETKSCACHIVSKKRYPTHARNKNNFVYASWLFHQYFDGLNTAGNIPCLIVRPEKVYTPSTFVFKGRRIRRCRIDVLIDFTTEIVPVELVAHTPYSPQ
jgi:hypothetical protein